MRDYRVRAAGVLSGAALGEAGRRGVRMHSGRHTLGLLPGQTWHRSDPGHRIKASLNEGLALCVSAAQMRGDLEVPL